MNIKLTHLHNGTKIRVRIAAAALAMLCTLPLAGGAQTVSVTGIVTNAQNAPIPGATIQIEGRQGGVVSDIRGRYSINGVSADAALIFSSLGHDSVRVEIRGRSVVNVSLQESATTLSDLVVIGYGTMRRRDLTGSIASVTAEDIEAKVPVNIFDALQGAAPGVYISSSSGAPGSESDIQIRGVSTFDSGRLPLYVVDGMPMDDISMLNPLDIASTEILKDAASAAIYGSRSANGVIIITTKKGTSGKPKVDIRYQQGFSSLKRFIPLTTPEETRFYQRERRRLTGGINGYDVTDSLRSFYNWNGDMLDILFRMAPKRSVDLSVSGATEKMNYYLSGNLYHEDGVMIKSGYDKLSLRLNTTYKANARLTLNNRYQFSYGDKSGAPESSVMTGIYNWLSFWSPVDIMGEPMFNIGGKSSAYAVAQTRINQTETVRGSLYNSAEYAVNEHLKITTNLSGDFGLERNYAYVPSLLIASGSSTNGSDITRVRLSYLNENYVNYARKFGDHNVTGLLGNSIQWWRNEDVRMQGMDYTTDLIYTINGASALDIRNSYSRIEEHSLASFFGRATYDYVSRYFLALNVRYDGSSRFGGDRHWGAFPSVSVGWRFSDEQFMQWMSKGLSEGKLRVSYGITGNESIGNYDAWQTYEATNYYDGVAGIAPKTLAYDLLAWESTAQTNFGAELGFWKGRIKVTADYYRKHTSELLFNTQVPKEQGYSTMRRNVGEIENRGFEIMVDMRLIRKKGWDWRVSWNHTWNNTVINKLADGTSFYTGLDNSIYVREGGRLGEIWGHRHDGVFAYDQSNAFDDSWNRLLPVFNGGIFSGNYTNLDGSPYSGNVNRKLKSDGTPYGQGDVNWLDNPNGATMGVIDQTDKVLLGCAQPDFFGGVSSTLQWKSISLYASFYYSIGGEVYNRFRWGRNNFQNDVIAPERYVLQNMWLYPGDNAIFPVPTPNNTDNRLTPSDYWIEDGSYVKLRTLRVSYKLPQALCRKIHMREMQVYVYGNNLMTWTNYSGNDPEFGGSSALAFGIDNGYYPRKVELGFGINLGF